MNSNYNNEIYLLKHVPKKGKCKTQITDADNFSPNRDYKNYLNQSFCLGSTLYELILGLGSRGIAPYTIGMNS